MSRVQKYQAAFTVGEIDPLIRGRVDIAQYFQGVSQAKNVIFEPQGGFSRRPGLKFMFDATNEGAANGFKLIPFEFSTTQSFMILVTAYTNNSILRFHFFAGQQLITNINGSGNNYLSYNVGTLSGVSTYDLDKINFAQNADTLIVVHENFQPFKIVRGTTNSTWTASLLDLTPPKHQFTPATTNTTTTLTPSATDDTVTLTAGAAFFTASHVDQYVEVSNGFGRARITRFVSTTVVDALAEVPFFDTDAVPAGEWFLDSGYEDAWSNNRGWPRTVTFHEGRLWFGGSRLLPQTLFASKVADFFNFKPAEALDDDAIFVTLSTDSLNSITGMRSGRDLQVFTTGAEFFLPQTDLEPITPNNIVLKSATKRGAKENVRPTAAETGTLFIQRQGKTLREMQFSDQELSYVSNNLSLLSSHLIVDPLHMALRPATDTTEGDLLLIVNGTSTTGYRAASTGFGGGIAAYMLNKQQNVVAPSFLKTDGNFKDVAVDIDTIYVVVERTIGGATKYFVEVFDDDFTTDSAVQISTGFSGTTYAGFAHLNGKTAAIIRDDIVDTSVTVAGGNITTADVPTSYIEGGLDFDVQVDTMPIETQLPSGAVVGQKKRILEISPVLYRTQNISINNRVVTLQNTNNLAGAGGVPTFTGVKKTQGFLGYEREAIISITMTQPVFLTVLSLDYKVSVGQ